MFDASQNKPAHHSTKKIEPWPWVITFLMLSVVAACVWTIVIAVKNPDRPAEGDYKKVGLAIESTDLSDDKQLSDSQAEAKVANER